MGKFVREHTRASGVVNFHRNESVSMLIKPVKPRRLVALGFDDGLDFDEGGLYEETEADDVFVPRAMREPSRDRENAYWNFLSAQMRTVLQTIVGYSELIEEDLLDGEMLTPLADLLKIRSASTELLDMAEQIEQLLRVERGKRHVAERLGSLSRQLNYAPERESIYVSMLSSIASLVPFKEACIFENSPSDWELGARWGKRLESGDVTVKMACSAVARTMSPCIQPMHGGGDLMTFPLCVDDVCVAALTLRGTFARDEQAQYAGVVMAFVKQVEKALCGWREMDEIKRQAMYDGLTGALNRRTFFAQAESFEGTRTVIMLDIDHFKKVNDEHGHAGGDAVLREVVRRIHATLRDHDLVGRYGGEEFALCLKVNDDDLAVEIAERIRLAICELTVELPNGDAVEVTASLGVVTGHEPLEQLLGEADELLYQAKRQGRNQVCEHDITELTSCSS
jgi:diguanylate cyclase (GGDEF)-like protein